MIGFIVFGLIVGFLARAILPGKQHIGLLWTLVLGVVGSVIGGTIANALGSGDIMELNVIGSICAVIAAVILLAIADRAQLGAGPRRGELGRG
ncbi:MAG: GlsB/YeaQ/YmgE family stress response membrane protein [Solirubrobacteraceae bacterium]|nr:GlsB/YeaQ/YmgE family stress response membrane protein [Solirubrobacteraceae bacterium]